MNVLVFKKKKKSFTDVIYLRILKCANFGLCRGTLNPMTSVLTAERQKEDWDRKRLHMGGRGNLTMEAYRRASVMGQGCLAPPEAWKAKERKAPFCHQRRGCPRHPNFQFLTIPKEKECKKAKRLSEEALQIAVKRREAKSKGEKERYTHLNAEFQRTARRDKKAFLSDQCKEIAENNRMGKIRDLFKKIRDTKGTFPAKMGSIKDRNGMDWTEAEDIKKKLQE